MNDEGCAQLKLKALLRLIIFTPQQHAMIQSLD